MIDLLDDTLAALLRRELPPSLADQVQISFVAPDDHFATQLVKPPAIDLFLYDVRENLELRSNEVYVERRSNGTATVKRAPVRVDFSYLVTAWATRSEPDPAQDDEHRLLGEVLRVLLRHKTIPGDVLQGELAAQDQPMPVTAVQQSRLQSLSEFWQALGGKPRTALSYVVTVAVDTTPPEDVFLVQETIVRVRPTTRKGD